MASRNGPDDLFGRLSESDSSDHDEEWDDRRVSEDVVHDLQMSCSSDDEDTAQEDSQPSESMLHEDYLYSTNQPNLSEESFSSSATTFSSCTSSSSCEEQDTLTETDIYNHVQYDPVNKYEIDVRHSPNVNFEWSDSMDASKGPTDTLSNSRRKFEVESSESNCSQDSSPIHRKKSEKLPSQPLPLVPKPATSWKQRSSKHQSAFKDVEQEQKIMTENEKEERVVSNGLLIGNFSEEQLDRYIAFRRSKFKRQSIKNIVAEVTGRSTNDPIAVAIGGLAKLFVGELVEEAVKLRDALKEQNRPVQPQHIKSAFDKLALEGKLWPPFGTKL